MKINLILLGFFIALKTSAEICRSGSCNSRTPRAQSSNESCEGESCKGHLPQKKNRPSTDNEPSTYGLLQDIESQLSSLRKNGVNVEKQDLRVAREVLDTVGLEKLRNALIANKAQIERVTTKLRSSGYGVKIDFAAFWGLTYRDTQFIEGAKKYTFCFTLNARGTYGRYSKLSWDSVLLDQLALAEKLADSGQEASAESEFEKYLKSKE